MFRNIFLTIIALSFSVSVWASDFTIHKLPSGQTLVVQEVHTNPIVTIDTWIRTGSINETDSNNGVAHFLEHLFFKGTKKYPVGEFEHILESKGAVVNAATSKDFTHYYITLPSEYFDKALELHSDMLTDPQIPRKELEKERKVVLEEISKDGNNPSKKVFNNLNEMMYSHHPYKRKVIGSSDIISTIRREEILEFFNKYYIPSNMITIVVGDVKTSDVVEKVSKAFNSEFKKSVKKKFHKENLLSSQKKKVEYIDAQSGYIMLGFRTVDISDSDVFALDVLAKILGDGKTSRFYKNIKEQKSLAYSISAVNASMKDDGIFYISANFVPTNSAKLEKSIFNEIEQIQKYGITQEELNIAQKNIEQETYYSRESTSDIALQLGNIITTSGSADLYKDYVANIKKVSLNDVQRVAQKYLGQNRAAISIALPKSLENYKERQIENHSAQKISEAQGVEKYLIDNKSILLINKHDNNDIVAINIYAKGGEFLESIPGEGTLVASTILKGTKKYSSQELSQLMEENGIKIVPSCSEDFFVLNVQTTVSQIDLTFEILNEILNNALFDDNELDKMRAELLNKIKQKRDVPMNIGIENFKTLIFENSVYSQTNKVLEKTSPTVTRSNILAYYNKIFDSKNIIVSINGNVETNKLVNVFGSILTDKTQPQFKYSDYSVTKLKTSKVVSQQVKDIETAWLFLGWQVAGVNDKKDFVTLKVINTILGGGMSSRLFRNLREQDGLAYQLGSDYGPKALAGTFLTYIGTNPTTLDYSKDKIKKEIERLKMEFVSDSELNDAKERLKGGFIIAMETNLEKASNIGIFEVYGFGYNFLNEYINMINEVTASDIVRVANKYFNNVYVESTVK